MSNYNGRRAPNVSQYLANLNTIPGPQEVAAQNDFSQIPDDLDFLTNTEFFDFDNFNSADGFPQQAGHAAQEASQQKAGSGAAGATNDSRFQFGEFQTYPTMTNSPTSSVPSPSGHGLQGTYPPQPAHLTFSPTTDAASLLSSAGDKRKASVAGMPSAADLEEASRHAAEEDKRRRNTAASARFRVKKKQREQALEKQTKDMLDKVSMLEGKVQQLEMENKWLKELITEKGKDGERAETEAAERSTEARTDGVGTDKVDA